MMLFQRLKSIIKNRGWKLYTSPYELNIVGLRSPITTAGEFDDLMVVFYKDNKQKWQFHTWPATTDPGLPYLHLPITNLGTAILAEGQYLDAYKIDKHRGKYTALCQRSGPVSVIRDFNRDSILDFNNGEAVRGNFGINIHRARSAGSTEKIDRYSAGCQVFKNAADFSRFMELCQLHKQLHGNTFTYSLVDFRKMRNANRRKWLLNMALIGGVALLAVLLLPKLNSQDQE